MSSIDRDMDALAVRFFSECEHDDFCVSRLGLSPLAILEQLLIDLDAGHCAEARIDAQGLRQVIANVLGYGGWVVRPAVAALLYRLRRCEKDDLEVLARVRAALWTPPVELTTSERYASEPLGLQVAFSELWEEPPPTLTELEAFHASAHASAGTALRLARVREQWPNQVPDAHAGRLADTDTPMLMLHGELDFIRYDSASRARDHYNGPGQTFVSIPRAPHATLFAPTTGGRGCAGLLIEQFLAAPDASLDVACASDIARIDFTSIGRFGIPMFGTDDIWDGKVP